MVKKVLIGDLMGVNITGGQITSRIEAKDIAEKKDTMKVLVPKAISNGKINKEELGSIDVKLDVDLKRVTKEGDIVIKLSTPYDACIVTKEDEGLLVPSFCAIINNVPEDLSKEYLLAFLNSKLCLMQIKNLVSGSTIAILSSGQIKKLEIPVPSFKEQKDIADRYLQYVSKIKLLEKIVKLENEYIDSKFFEMED